MTYAEFQMHFEAAVDEELERLSRLPAGELVRRIERHDFGNYHQAFAALASKRDLRLAGPVLARQLDGNLSYQQRYFCALALLSLLPYDGIPVHALADPSHPGHDLYREDLQILLDATLRRLAARS